MIEPIQQELAALNRFVELLQQEQAALLTADVDKLLPLSQEKLDQANRINDLERQRATWLAQQGFSADAEGMERWLAAAPAGTTDTWKALLEAARLAQHLNQTNGKLILTHLQHNQQALNALLTAANHAGVYGPDGQALAGTGSPQRTIGKV